MAPTVRKQAFLWIRQTAQTDITYLFFFIKDMSLRLCLGTDSLDIPRLSYVRILSYPAGLFSYLRLPDRIDRIWHEILKLPTRTPLHSPGFPTTTIDRIVAW